MEAVEAEYHQFPLEEYNSNPFIQALPPLMDKQSIIKKLTLPISFKEEDRNLDSAYRLHMIYRLYKMYQPMPVHLSIWKTIFTLIYQGYIARNRLIRIIEGILVRLESELLTEHLTLMPELTLEQQQVVQRLSVIQASARQAVSAE